MLKIKIAGTGLYVPGEAITNEELTALTGIEFSHEKFRERLGIEARHIAKLRGINESAADFATEAARRAIEDANISAEEIGLFIVATDTPEFITPATAIVVQGRIQKGERWAAAFDVASSCASFTMAFDTAASIIASQPELKYAVVVGVYNMPAFFRDDDTGNYPIFADGAGAFVLMRAVDGEYIGNQMLTDGTQWDYIGIYTGGAHEPVTEKVLAEKRNGLLSLQPLPGDRNVRLWQLIVARLLERYNVVADDIDHYIFTQINRSVIVRVMEALGQPLEKAELVMGKYGYTGSGCVPMAFHEGIKAGRIKRGDCCLFVASGAGLSVGSNLFVY